METGSPERAIIHVDMDAFYASVEQRDDPAIRLKPVIVGGTGRRGVVSAASYEARRFGVRSAMPVAKARRLCRQGIFLPPRMQRYREVSKQVFALFHEYTPLVEGLSLDEAFLDVTGSLRLFGDIETVGHSIKQSIRKRLCLVASVGMATNKFLAKLASDHLKPDGFFHVHPLEVRQFLDPMPISRLWGIGPKTAPRLQRAGILTMGQLRKAKSAEIEAVLGRRTAHFQKLVRGEDDRVVTPDREDKSISHEITFEQDISDLRELLAVLQQLSEQVGKRMRSRGLCARTIQIKIRDHRFRTYSRSKTLRAETGSTTTVYALASALLKRWAKEHRSTPLRLIGVGVSGLQRAPATPAVLDSTLDQINRRFGDGVVGRALGQLKDKNQR